MTKQKLSSVILETRSTGINFATSGVVRRATDRRVIHVTIPYPYGFSAAALTAAEAWAKANGYGILTGESQ